VTERLIKTLNEYAEPLLADMGLELVEIQFRREGHGWVLRFFIDSVHGVTIDDCAAVSREISTYLDVEDLIDHHYNLEVSSPGVERPLNKRQDFIRFAGRQVKVKLRDSIEGQYVFTGILKGIDENSVILIADNGPMKLDFGSIAKARLLL